MNSGAEAVETAIKISRKWGYEKKGIAENEALIVVCGQNFHGRTTTIISFSSDPDAKESLDPTHLDLYLFHTMTLMRFVN